MIGYHYFINSDSLVQKNEKTPAELIQYAVGFTHIFETGLKNGFYMDAIMGGLMYTEMRFMMGTPALTLADRIKIKEILEPYLNMLKPIRVSKLYSEKAVHERYAVVRDYLLHPEKWANGEDGGALFSGDLQQLGLNGNTDLLHSILEKNSATDMGRRYHFNDIVTIRGFKAMVPVSDYRTYEPLTALTSRIGESAIFVGEPVKYYIRFLTDGGRQRMLPVTESHLATYFPALDRACRGHVTFPLFEQLSLQNTYNDNTTSESIYAAVFQSYIEHKGKTGWGVDSRFVLPAAGLNDESSEDYYVRVLYALAEEKLTHIFAPNTYSVVRMMDFIQKNWRQLSGDLENGRISRRLEHPGSHTIKANPERAAKIREVMEKGATTRIVWPEFKCVTAKYDGEFQFYTNLLSQFMPGVEFRAADMIPEAMLGFSDGGNGFALNPEGGFFELKEDGADGLILPEEAKEGTNYRLYVTNQAGLYRYDTERYLRILRKEADGGTRYALNSGHDQAIGFGSIAVKPETLRRAAEQMQHEIGLRAVDYAFTLEKDEGLAMYIQPIASAQIGEAGVLAGKLDEYLRRACPGYAQERDAGRISPPRIRILNEETMHMFAETKAYKLRVAPDTVPLIHITEDPEYIRFLRTMAKE